MRAGTKIPNCVLLIHEFANFRHLFVRKFFGTFSIVMDHNTGRSRGFGFVEYYDIPTAESAIRNLSGKELNGRVLRVVFLQENVQHEHRAAGPGAGPRGGGIGSFGTVVLDCVL